MKRTLSLLAVALLTLASATSNVQAQRHLYFREDFSGTDPRFDTANWDLAADTSYKLMLYSMAANAGGLAPEAVWGYAPASGLSTVVSGTYRLVSKPFVLQTAARHYVSMQYFYQASIKSAEGIRSFGLAVRKPGDEEWTLCSTVNALKAKIGPARLTAELPAAFQNAADVQVAVYLQTRHEPRNNYMLYFDDIEFYAYPAAYYDVQFSWGGRPYTASEPATPADTLDLDLNMENIGNTLDSCKIAYTFDGGEPQYLSVVFDSTLLPGASHTLSGFKPEGWDEASMGHHTVTFRLVEANGVALSEAAVVKQTKTISKINPETFRTYAYKPLVEEFSSSSCSTCKPRNTALKPVFDELGDRISVVKYQMNFPGKGDPYYTEDGGLRKLFYTIYDIPDIYLNGWHDQNEGGTSGMRARFMEKINAATWFDITFDTLALSADTNVYIALKVKASVPMDNVRLHTAVIEGQTEGNTGSNGETEFHHVMLKMLPNGNGLPLDIKPDTAYTIRYAFDMKKTFMEEADDLKVVCFLQGGENDTVLQSAIAAVDMRIDSLPEIGTGDTTAVERVAYEILKVYPNPAATEVLLPGLHAATLDVFNTAGRRMFFRTPVTGDYVLDVRHYAPGFYIVRVQEAGRISYAKIQVVR